MTIAIIGGESTGKTTLATSLGQAFGKRVLAPLKPELLASSGYHTIFEWAQATNGWTKLLERQLERETGFEIVDDGLLQQYATVQRWGWNTIAPDRFEALRARIVSAGKYEVAIMLPPRLVGSFAPGRFRSATHNEQLTRLLRAAASEFGVRLVELAPGDAAQHLAAARAAIG